MPFKDNLISFFRRSDKGKLLIAMLGDNYIAGHNLKEGINEVVNYAKLGRYSTIDILGESSQCKAQADRYYQGYQDLIGLIEELSESGELSDPGELNESGNVGENIREKVSISTKPTTILPSIEEGMLLGCLEERLIDLVVKARKENIEVTLDMEDHNWTDLSLNTARSLWNEGYELGIVLQSRLNRTQSDIEKIFGEKYRLEYDQIRVRMCIGIYKEPKQLATNNRRRAKTRLVKRVEELFCKGVYVEIATHDHDIIRHIVKNVVRKYDIDSGRFEFQFLKGVVNGYLIERELMDQGFKVRYYMPTEIKNGDGTPYIVRRLVANPDLVGHGVRNIIQKIQK